MPLQINKEKMEAALTMDMLATDLADYRKWIVSLTLTSNASNTMRHHLFNLSRPKRSTYFVVNMKASYSN